MIQTTKEVCYDIRDLSKKAIRYAQIIQVLRIPIEKNYYIIIEEWTLINNIKEYVNQKTIVMSYEESNNLTDYLDANFEIKETKTERRDKYTILGHLLKNNQEQLFGADWELSPEPVIESLKNLANEK
jgi:hypothetical protein